MKLGFLTAGLPGSNLEQAAKWGAESGFQAIGGVDAVQCHC
jgi:sugar phosphate isomerase/epimerase